MADIAAKIVKTRFGDQNQPQVAKTIVNPPTNTYIQNLMDVDSIGLKDKSILIYDSNSSKFKVNETKYDIYVAGTGISISEATISIKSTYTGQTSITTLGTISTGIWNGTGISVPYGGTGVNSFTIKGILYGNGSGPIQVTPAAGTGDSNTTNQILTVDGNGVPVWASAIDGGFY